MALDFGTSAETLSWEEFELDQNFGWGNTPEPNDPKVSYEPPSSTAVGTEQGDFRNTLPSRKRPVPPQPEQEQEAETPEVSGFFGIGQAIKSGAEAVVDAGKGFFNAVSSPLFDFFDDEVDDLSETEDPEAGVIRSEKPYVIMKDGKTSTRVKMAKEPARAYSALQRDLSKRGKGDKVSLQENHEQGSSILSAAENWVGKEFNPGAGEQCANFVRSVCKQMGVDVKASANPVDKHLTGDDQGPAYANSFFGEDVGTLIKDEEDLMPGDIVGFTNTYGNYAPGTITHVGIYAGNGQVIDRPTANAPVKKRSVQDFGGVYIGVRPYGSGKAGARVGMHSISYDPSDPEVAQTAAEYGFTPTKRRGVLSYLGAHELEDQMLDQGKGAPIPYESDVDWNPDMERAYSTAWDLDIDPDVFTNLIKQESTWNPNARNKKSGAFGLTQLMPATAMEQARAMGIDATIDQIKQDPELQTLIGAGYYKRMLDQFGNHPQALAAYNAGPGRMQSIIEGGDIPEETVDYVSKILRIPPEKSEKLIRDFGGEYATTSERWKEESDSGSPNLNDPQESGSSFIKSRELEAEAEGSFFTPKTQKEEEELLEGLRKSETRLPPEMQNFGAQRKDAAKKELVASLSSSADREGDWNTIADSLASSTYGMLVEALDQVSKRATPGASVGSYLANEVNKRIFGSQAKKVELASPTLAAVESILGSSPQVKEDFEFGRLRTSKWLKGFGNTLSFGIMNYLSPNGTIYTEEELKNSEQIKEAARMQGGAVMSDRPVDPKSWHATYLNMMADISDNPLSFLAVPLQMQAMASMGTSAALTTAVGKSGAPGKLAGGVQHFLNYMGGKAATGKGSSWVAQALTNSAVRFEVSTGLLTGAEVFNNALAENLHLAADGKVTVGEAFAEASQSAAIATGLGMILGLGATGGGLLAQQTLKGVKSGLTDFGEKPLVQAAKNSRFGNTIAESVNWAASRVRSIEQSERFAHIREIRNNVKKGALEMYDRHVGKYVQDFVERQAETSRRSSFSREAYHGDTVARKLENQSTAALEFIRQNKEVVQKADGELQKLVDSKESVRGLGNDPLSALEFNVQRTREAQKNIQDLAKAIARERKNAEGPGSVPETVKELLKQQIESQKLIKDLEPEINRLKGEVQKVANENGVTFVDVEGKPISFTQLEAQIEAMTKRNQSMPERKVLKEAPVIEELAKAQQMAARVSREKAAQYREIGEGRKPLPETDQPEPWTPEASDLSPDTLEAHLWSMHDRPGKVLPEERLIEIENLILEQAPMQKTLGSIERFIKSLDKVLKGKSEESKAILGPQIKAIKESLEETHNSGKNAWRVLQDLRAGGGDTILDSAILKSLANRTPQDVHVPLYKMSQESNATRMALLSKLSELNYGEARTQAKKVIDQLRQTVEWEKENLPLQNLIDAIVSLRISESMSDLSKEAGGTDFIKNSGIASATTKDKLSAGVSAFKQSRADGKGLRESIAVAVADAFSTMSKNSEPLNIVRASSREMVSSKRAYENLGAYIQELVDSPEGIFKTGVRKYISGGLPSDVQSDNIVKRELALLIADSDNPEEAVSNYMADLLFEGGSRLSDHLKEIPELESVISPVVQIHNALDHMGLLSPDVKTMADHFYIKSFFPGMKRYDKLRGGDLTPSRDSRKILQDAGVIDEKGKPTMRMADIDNMVRTAKNRLGKTDHEKFIKMTMEERQHALGKLDRNYNPDGTVIPVSEEDANETLAAIIMQNRLKNPGEVARARVASIGNAETQRKFLQRLASATDANGQPLVFTGSKPPEGYIPISKVDKITPQQYQLNGQNWSVKDIHMKKEALEVYDDIMGDWNFGNNEAMERMLRTVNSLALQGWHSSFLVTIGANVWKGFGFNMAKTSKAFNLRNDLSPGEFTKIVIRASQAGLEDQSVARNATLLSKSFLADNKEILSEMSKSLMQQPGWESFKSHLGRQMMGEGAEGVFGRAGKVIGNTADGLIAMDEFLMEHLLFQNLRDSQYGLWMFKANEVEAKIASKMLKEGYSPEAVRDMAEREAATFVNTFTGSVEKGIVSKNARGLFGVFGMTPQFTMARLRSIVGAINENTFQHMPAQSRPRLAAEYRSMVGKMALAGLASSALFQYALSGRSIVDNPEDKQFKIWAGGDHYFSNPLATFLNTISKLTGTQELGRMLSLSTQEALGFEVPRARLNSMERDSVVGSMAGAAGAMINQSGRQFTNLTNPLLRTGLQATFGDGLQSVNPEEDFPTRLAQAGAKNSGLFQAITNRDPWTGDKQPGWHRVVDALGIYATENRDIKSHDLKVRQKKKQAKELIRRDIGKKIKAAYEYQAAGDLETAEKLYKEAYMSADPHGRFQDGGISVNKETRRLLRIDGSLSPDGRVRLTEQEWFNAIKAARFPQEYQLEKASTNVKPDAAQDLIDNRKGVQDVRENRKNMGAVGGFGEFVGAI